jgi:5'-nucleotidase
MNPQSSVPLVVGVSSAALLGRPGDGQSLPAGPALPLVQALRGQRGAGGAELVLLSREAAEAGPRAIAALRGQQLTIDLTAFTGGASCSRYLSAFEVDLFLTADEEEAREAAEAGRAAALVLSRPSAESGDAIRIAVDLDDAWDGSRERSRESESDDAALAPLASLIKRLRGAAEAAGASLRIAWVTSRGSSHQEESIRRLGRAGLRVDEAFSLSGLPREAVLRAFGAQLLFEARTLPAPPESKPEPSTPWAREGRPEAEDSSDSLETPFSRLRGRR